MGIVSGPVAVHPEDTLRMPSLQLDSLLGRAREDEEPVFPLVRRRARTDAPELLSPVPKLSMLSASVSILSVVAVVLGVGALLWLLR
jgi:hypothetical protein